MKITRRNFIFGVLFVYSKFVFPRKLYETSSYLKNQISNAFKYRIPDDMGSSIPRWSFGTGMHNFQYHAFDEINRSLYTLQHSSFNLDGGKITRFPMDSDGEMEFIDAQSYNPTIGHQFLSVEYQSDGDIKLWAAKGPKESLSLVRFNYNADGKPLNLEEYILFDHRVFGCFYMTGCISYDQKWIIVRGRSRPDSKYFGYNCIAIFNLKKLLEHGPGCCFHLAEHFWVIDHYLSDSKHSNINPQSIISDGYYIYVLYGPSHIELQNILRKYNFNGDIVFELNNLDVGKVDAMTKSDGHSNEIEGAQFIKINDGPPVLTIGLIQGGPLLYKNIYIVK